MSILVASSSSMLSARTVSILAYTPRFLHPLLPASITLPQLSDTNSEASSSTSNSPSRLATLLPSLNGLIELFPHILLGTPPKRRHTYSRKMMKFANKGLKNRTSELSRSPFTDLMRYLSAVHMEVWMLKLLICSIRLYKLPSLWANPINA
jgi:hypothetical protein